jgi:CHAD domain-containing protein
MADRKQPDAVAVHEFRKAMKRWRALLRLLEPILGKQARKQRLRARDLARQIARPRDVQAALDGLGDALKHEARFSPATQKAIRAQLQDARRQAERAMLTEAVRHHLSASVRSATHSIERWPVARIGLDEITDCLTETYQRARRKIPKNWKDATAEELHELRRRVIEHRYQMELVAPLWPRLGKLWVEEAQRLRDRLGRYHDLVVLSGLTSAGKMLAPWRSRLVKPIAERQADHLATAARLAGRLFAERPKAFRRRLRAIWQARERGHPAD